MSLWNFTIDDTSPYLLYFPYSDGSISSGWQTWYSVSQFNTGVGQVGQGDSYHLTSLSNASVTLQFMGTGISLFGFSNSSFDVAIDNGTHTTFNAPVTSDSLLYSNFNLTNELHSLTLRAQPSPTTNTTQMLGFDFAIASIPLSSDENPPSPLFFDNSNTAVQYNGSWTAVTQNGVPNGTVSAPFRKTTEVGASVSLSFSGASAVVVKGPVSSESGLYSVSLDGNTTSFNGTSSWLVPDSLLYYRAGLDPTSNHELTVTNLGSGLCLNSVTVFMQELRNAPPANSTETSRTQASQSSKFGTILGPILGFLVVALLFISILLWRRRRAGQSIHTTASEQGHPRRFTFTKPKSKSKSERKPDIAPTRPPPPPAPMVTSLDHSVHTAFDTRSIHTDTHSTTNLITGFGHQRMQSTASSEAGLSFSQASQMDPDPFARWDRSHQIAFRPPQTPTSDPTTPSSTSTRQRSIFRASMQRVASSSSSMAGSSRQGHIPVPDYIPLSPRKPLPNIPVPSYDAALRAPELTPQDVKDFSSFQFADEHAFEHEHAPPQYER